MRQHHCQAHDRTYIGRFSPPLALTNHHFDQSIKSEIAENASLVPAYQFPRYTEYGELLFRVICFIGPCGEVVNEDDVESGSPFSYIPSDNTADNPHPQSRPV